MTLLEAIQSISILFPNQGEQGIEIRTIGGRPGHFFKVFYYTEDHPQKLQIESSTGDSWAEITETFWNAVYERYTELQEPIKSKTSSYGNNWENQPAGLNRNIAPYLAGLIHYLSDEEYRKQKQNEVANLNVVLPHQTLTTTLQQLLTVNNLQNQLIEPQIVTDIPAQCFMVYMLFADENLIVAGAGKRNRARVIFDNKTTRTKGHIKALKVRFYHLYTESVFTRFIIICSSKEEAGRVEKLIHQTLGGNSLRLPPLKTETINSILEGSDDPCLKLLISIAIMSSFDGLNDLCRWRNEGLINDARWIVIQQIFGELD